jgi:hypothetical protein
VAIQARELRILFQKSGNRCAFPGCRRVLTADGSPPDRDVVLGDVAHIVAESINGPRGDSLLSLMERNRYDNLILLCNLHHQLIDGQPQTYTIERLRGMKQEHERWVEDVLGARSIGDLTIEPAAQVTETVYSTLLPVEHMPRYVYGVPCLLTDEHDVQRKMLSLRGSEMAPFILRAGMLFVFQDLEDPTNPFRDLTIDQPIERFRVEEWWEDADKFRWFIELTNRTLNKLTGRRGLYLDKEHHRYYFAMTIPGKEVQIRYRPLNRKRTARKVVWQPKSKRTGEGRGYWYHRAVALRFLRDGDRDWSFAVRPELRVTIDGVNPPKSREIGSKVTRKKSRMFNYNLLGEVQFWRDYLSDSRPRIILPFGSANQHIVVSTAMMFGKVSWPGIPPEHAKPFKNIEYVDDLFSWAELSELEAEPEENLWQESEEDGELDEGFESG